MKTHMDNHPIAAALTLSLVAAIPGPNASAQPFAGFAPQTTIPVGAGPWSIVTDDLNSDGALDLVVPNETSGDVSVLLGDGAGGFSLHQTLVVGTPPHLAPQSVAIGDFNGDGALDLAVTNIAMVTNDISIFFGDGSGSFGPQQMVTSGGGLAHSIVTGDVNSDGALDLAVVHGGANTASVLLGNGAGGFTLQQTMSVGFTPYSLTMGDLDNDGDLDLAVANPNDNDVSILLGNGAGSFAPQQTFPAGTQPLRIANGDLNGDGMLDLAVANGNFGGSVSVLFGTGGGAFGPPLALPAGNEPFSVAIADLNGDGAQDISAPNYDDSTVSVFINNGAGSFAPQQTFPVGTATIFIAIGDFDGNSSPDLAVVNNGGNNVSILINQTVFAAPSPDLNGDGVVNGADLATLLTQWGTNGPADLNSDGVVNGADLATLLTNWGPV